jgi:hypothetical protein
VRKLRVALDDVGDVPRAIRDASALGYHDAATAGLTRATAAA